MQNTLFRVYFRVFFLICLKLNKIINLYFHTAFFLFFLYCSPNPSCRFIFPSVLWVEVIHCTSFPHIMPIIELSKESNSDYIVTFSLKLLPAFSGRVNHGFYCTSRAIFHTWNFAFLCPVLHQDFKVYSLIYLCVVSL
jgi:hypothetical protein